MRDQPVSALISSGLRSSSRAPAVVVLSQSTTTMIDRPSLLLSEASMYVYKRESRQTRVMYEVQLHSFIFQLVHVTSPLSSIS
jgi:hypothetical protein